MASLITKGRTEPCLNNIGGINKVHLFKFVDYQRYLIEVSNGYLTSFPTTEVNTFELMADGNNLAIDLQEDENGVSYNQSLSIVIKGNNYNNIDFYDLLNLRVGCIVELRSGVIQIIGLYNGCKVKSVKGQTGGGYTDFNGINIEIEAREKESVFYLTDLVSVGFEITENFIFQDGNNFIFQDGNNFIFN